MQVTGFHWAIYVKRLEAPRSPTAHGSQWHKTPTKCTKHRQVAVDLNTILARKMWFAETNVLLVL